MKNKFPYIISVVTSSLIAYGFFALYKGELYSSVHYTTGIAVFIYSIITLSTSFGGNYESNRIKTVVSYIGSTFFVFGIVLLFIVMIFSESIPWVILPMGLLLVIYLSTVYFVSKSGQ